MKRSICLVIVFLLSASSCTASMRPDKTELATSTPETTSAAASALITPAGTPTPGITPESTAPPDASNGGIATRPPIKEGSFKLSPGIISQAASVEIPERTAMPDFIDGDIVIGKDNDVYYQNQDAICKKNIVDKTDTILRQTNGGIQEMFFGYDNELYYIEKKYGDERGVVYSMYMYNKSGDILLLEEKDDSRNDLEILGISDKAIYLMWSVYLDTSDSHIYKICSFTVHSKNIKLLFYFSKEDNLYIKDFRDGLLYFLL